MSALTLNKLYLDTTLLYVSDIHDMWTTLETKTNGNLDSDNVVSGWANLGLLTLAEDITFTMGLTDTGYILFTDSSNEWKFGTTYATSNTIFKVESAEAARIDGTSNDLLIKKEVYFKDRSTAYSLSRIIGTYQKPVLVYVSATLIDVEANTETANHSLIVFPSGPIGVTEDTAATNKFRRLSTAATANGYGAAHTGAADSGLKSGLTLSASTWYFVYAVRVQYGDDAGNNFILVVDDTSPVYTNETTLNSLYGTDEWVYLGTIRRGYGTSATTTFVAFQQDHQGWTYFIDRGAASNYFGIEVATTTVTSTAQTVKFTMSVANSGTGVPANITAVKFDLLVADDGDLDFEVMFDFGLSTTSILSRLPHVESDGGQLGFSFVAPVISGAVIASRTDSNETTNDAILEIYITGFLDHYV